MSLTESDMKTGCGSVWLERLVWDQEVAGSNPVTPIKGERSKKTSNLGDMKLVFMITARGCSSMVEHQPSKLDTWVRFPSPALILPNTISKMCS